MSESAGLPRIHSFEPVYDEESRLLILGTMASPASLRAGFYYGHPQNAFWRMLSEITGDETGATKEERRAFLLRHGIALWDTLESCSRPGALDGNITSERPNDIARLVAACPLIRAVFLNGAAAYAYYKRYHAKAIPLPFYRLPSSSPANAKGGYSKKLAAWRAIAPYLK